MLKQLDTDLWTSSTFLGLGLMSLTRRMTIVRLPCGSLWLHSPNDLSDALLEQVLALGPVRWLIAPNLFHHRALVDWKEACPEATLLAVPGLAEKEPQIPIDDELRDDPPEQWGGAIDMLPTWGAPRLNEVVFFHDPSRTLILTDFVFNHGENSGLPWLSRLLLKGMKAYGSLGPSRLFRFLVKDEPRVGDCIRQMLDRWPVERLSMSHGEIVEVDASERLRAAYAEWGEETPPAPRIEGEAGEIPLPVGQELDCFFCHSSFTVVTDQPGAQLSVDLDTVTEDGPADTGSAMSHSLPVPAWIIPCPECGAKQSCRGDTADL